MLEEILQKALESDVISESQQRYYLLKYRQGEQSLSQIQQQIAQSSSLLKTRKRDYPVVYDKYVLKTCLGRGGMGEIFEAYHRDTWEKVALKKIKSAYQTSSESDERIRKRFMRECSLQANLQHPNIVKVYDYGVCGRDIFLVTQLIEGETLQQLVEREKHDARAYHQNVVPPLLEQMVKICEAVDYAHRNGIIHRDINPSNIMIDDRQIWIMDFGLAKRYDIDITKVTRSTEVVGTPSYMSPEQWNNEEIGPASDIYSLGATIYYLITCQPPQPEDPLAAAYNIINQLSPNPIASYRVPVPAYIASVVERAMAYPRAERYPNAAGLGKALKDALGKWNRKPSMFQKLTTYLRGKGS